ncbi:MAG: cupin domain-containing protein [Methanomicrobiaceae archaeon]|nr:cupin domain-containing protein [Methanomicrobiaceae archaeon]
MIVRDIKKAEYFTAGDGCTLCELLHPDREAKKGVAPIRMNASIAHAFVRAGEKTVPHRMRESTEIYYIIAGSGIMHIDGEEQEVCPGQAVYIPPGSVQWIECSGDHDLELLAVADPRWREEDEDIFTGET